MRSPGLGQGRQRLVGHPAIKSARSALVKFNDDSATGRRSADAATYFLQRALRRAVGSFWQAARVTALCGSPRGSPGARTWTAPPPPTTTAHPAPRRPSPPVGTDPSRTPPL